MKNIALLLLTSWVTAGFSYGQVSDQNPNYQSSIDLYTKKLQESPNTMSTTVQNTYKAIDEWQDKKDRKIENARLTKVYKQERRLAKINRPRYYYNPYAFAPNVYGNYSYGYNNLGYGYGNSFGYGNGFGIGYTNGYCGTSAYYRPYSYPVNFRIGASVRIGNNVWLSF